MVKKNLRIVHIDTERTWRGGQQQVFSLIQGLEALGHHNVAVVRRGSELGDRFKKEGIALREVSPVGEFNFIDGHFLNRWIRREGIDLVHAHTAHAVALAALATMGTSIPFVLSRRVDFHLSNNPFSRWKYRRAQKIIAISDAIGKILKEDGISAEKIAIIPSGVDFDRYAAVIPLSKESMGVPKNFPVVGQVAALADHKDQTTFLKAIALLKTSIPNIRAVIVGDGPKKGALVALSKSLGLEEAVRFFGFQEDSLNYLAGFDVFCLSSKEEGLGTSLLDAMALKIPVVATRAGGIPEVVEHGQDGILVAPQDPAALAAALKYVLEHKDRHRFRDHAYQKARQFEVAKTVSRTDLLYRSLGNSSENH
jgi:glycosyltransferase involved in cell wall biosynthesis